MEKVKVINKGYTITVVSWENDGDNYNTNSKTVDTKEEAEKINFICKKLFVSCNNGDGGIGNAMDGDADEIIEDFIANNTELNLTYDYVINLSHKLMGGSEFYDHRVCESCEVTYSPEDIYLEKINF